MGCGSSAGGKIFLCSLAFVLWGIYLSGQFELYLNDSVKEYTWYQTRPLNLYQCPFNEFIIFFIFDFIHNTCDRLKNSKNEWYNSQNVIF